MAEALMTSDEVNRAIDGLLLSGQATSGRQAEGMFLDASLPQIAALVEHLSDDEFERHGAIRLLFALGSRTLEDRVT